MNVKDKHGGQQQIIDNALPAMGHDPSAEGFDPKKVNLADFQRRTGFTRSKSRTLQKKGLKAGHGRCGMKSESTVLAGFEEDIDELLRQGVTNSSVRLERIRAKGCTGGLTEVKEHIAANSHLVPAPRRIAVQTKSRGQRFDTAPGEAYQMDWGFVDVEDPAGGTWRMACFAMVCHHCGTCYVEFFPNARQENLFIGMIHAFVVMGVPDCVLTDNMRSVVIRRDREGRPVWQADCDAFMRCIGFRTKLCKPYHPYTKGKVERLIRFVKGNFLAGRAFSDITDLNVQALEWCATQAGRWRRSIGSVPADVHVSACLPAMHAVEQAAEVAMYLCPEGVDASVFDRVAADAKAIGANATAAEIARLAESCDMGAAELEAVATTMAYLAAKKRERAVQIHLNMSHIPQKSPKTFENFDFGRIQGRGSAALTQLPTLSNLYARRNLALIGPEGVGKTHLAQAYGRACCMQGMQAYYIKARELSEKLAKAVKLGTVNNLMNQLIRPACLIVDEIGRCKFDKERTDLLFHVVDARCEKDGPNLILMTSNFTADKWDEFFTGGSTLLRMLDRLFDDATVFMIKGTSHRGAGLETFSAEAIPSVAKLPAKK